MAAPNVCMSVGSILNVNTTLWGLPTSRVMLSWDKPKKGLHIHKWLWEAAVTQSLLQPVLTKPSVCNDWAKIEHFTHLQHFDICLVAYPHSYSVLYRALISSANWHWLKMWKANRSLCRWSWTKPLFTPWMGGMQGGEHMSQRGYLHRTITSCLIWLHQIRSPAVCSFGGKVFFFCLFLKKIITVYMWWWWGGGLHQQIVTHG